MVVAQTRPLMREKRTVTRWRVRLPARRILKGEAAGVFLIEIDPGGGFRPATVVEVDSALRQRELFGATAAPGERSTVERSTVGAGAAVEHGAGAQVAVSPGGKRAAGGPGGVPPSRSTVGGRSIVGRSTVPPSRPESEPGRPARGGPRRKRAGWNLPPSGSDGQPVRRADRDREIRLRREAGETVRSIAAALGCGVGTVARALGGEAGQ